MGFSAYIQGWPTAGSDITAALVRLQAVLPLADKCHWGCEEFYLPDEVEEDGSLGIFVKVMNYDDGEKMIEDIWQCVALAVGMSRLTPDWIWSVSDDIQAIDTDLNGDRPWLRGGVCVRVAGDPEDPRGAAVTDNPALDEALRAVMKSLAPGKLVKAIKKLQPPA